MRILLTTDTIGGVWTYSRELSEGLLKAGCEVYLLSLGRLPDSSQSVWTERMLQCYAHKFRYLATDCSLEWMQDNAACYTGVRDLIFELINSFQPHLLHLNQLCFGALPAAVPKLVTVHSDVVSWFEACRGEAPPRDAWFAHYEMVVTQGLREADYVVAPTAWMMKRASQIYGPFAQSSVIANGRSRDRDPGSPQTSERKLQAITAGRMWDEAKNLSLLEKINSPIPLLIAGECEFENSSAKASPGTITCLGSLSEAELFKLMAESLLYIAPSKYEPFGLAPLEAALTGCALLVMDIPSFREVWGEAALYFRNTDDLSRLLTELASNPAELRRLARAAESRARELYSRERMTTQYLDLYRILVGQEQTAGSARHVA